MRTLWRTDPITTRQTHVLLKWVVVLFVLPMAVFVAIAMLQMPSRQDALERVGSAQLWLEPLGPVSLEGESLARVVRQAPDFSAARWQPVTLPNSVELGASIDLPADAPKQRAWFRFSVSPALQQRSDSEGRLGLMGNRVMGGAWAVWVDGRLLQANLADWRIQWNTPMRVMLPQGVREVLVAVPHAQAQGYAMGSLFLGPADAVDAAWQWRHFWHLELPKLLAIIGVLLVLVSLHLALRRPQEPVFALLSANALVWSIGSVQYFIDFTGQPQLSLWFAAVVDVSTNWMVVLNFFFIAEFERIKAVGLRLALIAYGCASTLLTLPLWHWGKNALMLQHSVNAVVCLLCIAVLAWHVWRSPRREGVLMVLGLVLQLVLGLHSLLALVSQTHPDHVHTYALGVVLTYLTFMYALSRRTVLALDTAESHEVALREQLSDQEMRLATQHALLQRMEVERSLTHQHETIMQDLHDRLGSNLTSALLQARGGALSPGETVLLLQDLTDELRHLGKSTTQGPQSLNQILAELRDRVHNRLGHGGITLAWDVDPLLPPLAQESASASQHLRALFSEAVANTIKHAKATQIRVEARARAGAVVVSFTDNGQGFDPGAVDAGRGLPGMRQRARQLGAQLRIASAPHQGCRWQLTLALG